MPAAVADLSRTSIDSVLGKTVTAIEVKGLKRIEKDAVTGKILTKVGQAVTRDRVRGDVQAVFAMGFFDDITVESEASGSGVTLTFTVRERPVISKIEFDGNERITTKDLQEVVKVKEWSILDINKVREDVGFIQKHYEEKGYYLAKVTFDVKQVKPDEVELVYKVNDYDKVQIKKITFLNNKAYNDEALKATLGETREGSFLSFMNSSGNFKEAAFKQDLQRLTYWYLDHGYVKFRYDNPVVTVSDDKKWLYISIYVEEGEKYQIGPVDFAGDLLFGKDELHKELTMPEGDDFSISKRNGDIQRLTEKYQDLGYAFTNVIPKMNIHDDTRLVDINYEFEKGSLVYYREINVLGNSKTHDKVIRRELKIHEGELYSGTKLRQSKENVERLGYFAPGEIVFNTITPKGKQDVVDVEITVKERSTGTITLGAGYGSVQGFFFTTQVSEINLLGRGQTVSLSGQYSADRKQRSFNFGFTEPYTFDTLWSSGFDLYSVNYVIPNKYLARKLGFDVRFGHPIADYVYGYVTYKNEGFAISEPDDSLSENEKNEDIGVLSSVTFSVVRDKRNNRFETTDGNYQNLSLELAGIGGDKKFYKATANNRYYKKLIGDLVLRNSFEVGKIDQLTARPVPPSEKFYLGGPNNMKGFNLFTLGPSKISTSTANNGSRIPLGAAYEAFGLFELEYPLIREAGLKWVLFYDVGNAWDRFPSDNLAIRQDTGFGIRWFSPIGPLRFEWGFPLNAKPGEDNSVFNFFIGPPF